MDITPATTPTTKTPEPTETDTPTRAVNPSNGVLKRHAPLTHHHHHHHPIVITYKECLKNHAAALGTHAVDGCGEFMPSSTSNPSDPTSLKCAACGCHRNFHRRDPDENPPQLLLPPPPLITDYTPHHRHHPPPPTESPTNSPSPPPISSAYAPHMLLALSHAGPGVGGGGTGPPPELPTPTPIATTAYNSPQIFSSNSRKRFRTKFTQDQKEKMLELAEKVGWKMQKKDEDTINEDCTKIGVDKGVFKVWMHNNKNTVGRKDQTTPPPSSTTTNNNSNPTGNGTTYNIGYLQEGNKDKFHDSNGNGRALHHHQVNHHHNHLGTNGSSTSS